MQGCSLGCHARSRSEQEGKGELPRPWLQRREERKRERLVVEVAISFGVIAAEVPSTPWCWWSGLGGLVGR